MSNEELASRIQQGGRELIPELWAQVERFVSQQAGKRARALNGFGGTTEEDLYQSGFLALVDAVDSYDPAAGCSFIGWLAVKLRTSFAEAGGYRSRKQALDPLHRAGSLDVPLGDDKDGATLGDLQPDPTQGFEEVEEQLWREQLHVALESALEAIPAPQADALRRKFWYGETLEAISAGAGVCLETIRQRQNKALRTLRHPRTSQELRAFIEERTSYYGGVGLSRFNATGSGQPERLAIMREGLAGGHTST